MNPTLGDTQRNKVRQSSTSEENSSNQPPKKTRLAHSMRRTSKRTGYLSNSDDDSLLAGHILNVTLPRLQKPSLEQYDSSGDLDDHVQNYRTTMKLHGENDSRLCMAIPTTLKKLAQKWYISLLSGSIHSIKDLAYAFHNQFVSRQKKKKNPT